MQADEPGLRHADFGFLDALNTCPKALDQPFRLKRTEVIEDGSIDTGPWITHRANVDDMIAAFPSWLKPENGVIKAMVALTIMFGFTWYYKRMKWSPIKNRRLELY